ncbi:MAG: right-handed parallel beta-helix repeat-containing protein [Planctomycetes bacterium]|nr:right-handed parallel beta-helix repeat-containing protein [Planctomycetota bacterium]
MVRFSNSEGRGAVLDGFTITGASGGIGCGPNSEPTIRRCRMEFNFAATGPGIDCFEANPLIVNCEFFNNEATLYNGGAILCNRSSPVIANCLIKGNGAMIGGGGIYCYDNASPTIVNCNLYLNGAKWGGGVFADNNSHPTLANCIVWLNYPGALVVGVDSSITATYSSIQSTPVYPGIGNIAESPHFHTSGDFRLVPGSPGIDAGDNSAVPVEALLDLDGLPRLADDTFTDDTGAGTAPIVDMGVYEYRDCDEDGDPDPLKFGDCSVSPKWCDCNQNGLLDECDIDDGRANDCNLNDVPDVCEGPGDFDADGDVDLINFAFFRSCQTPPIASQLFGSCCFFDFDVDLDVDLRNFAQFQNGFDPS